MLMFTKELKDKYVEIHTSSKGDGYYVVEEYNKTPKGRICNKSYDIEKHLFDLLTLDY